MGGVGEKKFMWAFLEAQKVYSKYAQLVRHGVWEETAHNQSLRKHSNKKLKIETAKRSYECFTIS